MTLTESEKFVHEARRAPLVSKRDWILQHIAGKRVLDLGVVDHDVARALANDDLWLHGQVKKRAGHLVGVDILESATAALNEAGYNVVCGDATQIRLDEKFDVIVCGDLIEHVVNPLDLLQTIAFHLAPAGRALLSTPNPLSVSRIFNIWADMTTPVNPEHVSWYCPQTIHQLVSRSDLRIDKLVWLETDYPAKTRKRGWRHVYNAMATRASKSNRLLSDDFGVELLRRDQ